MGSQQALFQPPDMPSLQAAAALLEQALRIRQSLLGGTSTRVTRESLDGLSRKLAPLPQISNLKSEMPLGSQLASLREAVSVCRQCEHLAA